MKMNKRSTLAVVTTFAVATVLTGCGEDEGDCESSAQLSAVSMSIVEGKTGGSSGGGSRSGSSGSKGGGSSKGGGKTGTSKQKPVKVDDDLFEECDD